MNYTGLIIEESLKDKSVLNGMTIIATRIVAVTKEHQTPWHQQWTMHTVEISDENADEVVEHLSRALNNNNWYADFKNHRTHFIVFRNKVFRLDISKSEQYETAKNYGIAQGIPYYQLDFSPDIKD